MWIDPNTFSQKEKALGACDLRGRRPLQTYALKHPSPQTCSNGGLQRVRGTVPVTVVFRKDPSLRDHIQCGAERPGMAVGKAGSYSQSCHWQPGIVTPETPLRHVQEERET